MATSWFLRKGTPKSGFRYVNERGAAVSHAARVRAEALVLPPAWREVHVAASPGAAVQAWGYDAKGRKQYRYHDQAVERGALRKYYRVRQLGRDLPTIRARLREDFAKRGLSKARVTAGVVRLIGTGFFRVGSERYAKENKTFGITTLRKSHVRVEGDLATFSYVGKKSIAQHQVVADRELARFVGELLETPGRRLFQYESEGGWCDLTARDVNDYLHELVGVPYTAKDFRTWGGTLRAATVLAELGPAATPTEAKRNVMTAVRLVAAELGNTPAICRASYVHPMVIGKYLDEGETIKLSARRRGSPKSKATKPDATREGGHAEEERALLRFLDAHFPERRRRPRSDEEPDSSRAA
jgi:DNA topoisomerase-1